MRDERFEDGAGCGGCVTKGWMGRVTIGIALMFSLCSYADNPSFGTPYLLKDIRPGTSSSFPNEFVSVGDLVFFGADNDVQDDEPWITDGTEVGTILLKDINAAGSSRPASFRNAGGVAYFLATETGDSDDLLIWRSDGTNAGTTKVVTADLESMYRNPEELTVFDNLLLFSARSQGFGRELWATDGTPTGTRMLLDIRPGSPGGIPRLFSVCNGTAYFLANDPAFGEEIFVTDGTPEGTRVLGDLFDTGAFGFAEFECYGELLLFKARDPETFVDLWRSDGTASGTQLVVDTNTDLNLFGGSSEPSWITSIGNIVVYRGITPENGLDLMRTDATAVGTFSIKDIDDGTPSFLTGNSFSMDFFPASGYAYFTASSSDNEYDLWGTDGTELGTQLLLDPNGEDLPSFPSNGVTANGYFLFRFLSLDSGVEPWISDGTPEGTKVLVDQRPGIDGSYPQDFAVCNGRIYYRASSEFEGPELWVMNVAPTVTTIALLNAQESVNQSSLDFEIRFSEPVTGVDASDFQLDVSGVEGASVTGVSKGTGYSFIVLVDPGSGDGTVTLSLVDDNTILDLDGLALGGIRTDVGDIAAADAYIVRDVPEVVLSSTAPDPTDAAPIRVNVFFSELVSGFALEDISVGNGSASGLIGAEQSWSFDLTPDGPGVVTAHVLADAVTDIDTNGNLASNVFERSYSPAEGEGTVEGSVEGTGDGEGQPEGEGEGAEEGQPEGTAEGEGSDEGELPSVHTSDQNGDNVINLSELLRVIQFFNSDGFGCEDGTEDGYAPSDSDTACPPHASDYNPQDWEISLSELLRLIQFFNSGGYNYCAEMETEDGYCPGL